MDQPDPNNNPALKATKKSKKEKYWRNLFKDKFIDLVIVIVSILIAYELTIWQADRDHRSTERYYLESVLNDLNKDIEELSENLETVRKDSTVIALYMRHMDEWPDDSLAEVLLDVLSMETFVYNNNTYQSLLSSNGLNTFSDRILRAEITAYYNVYVSIFRFEDVYTQLILKINDYYVDDVDYVKRKVVKSHNVDKTVTGNYLLLAMGQLLEAIEGYEDALAKSSAVKKRIKESLR